MKYYKVTVQDKQFLLKVKDSSKLVNMVKEFAKVAQPFLIKIGRSTGIEYDKRAQDELYKKATDVYTQIGREVQNMKSKGMEGTLDKDDDFTWYDTNLNIGLQGLERAYDFTKNSRFSMLHSKLKPLAKEYVSLVREGRKNRNLKNMGFSPLK